MAKDRPRFEVVTPIGEASEGWLVSVDVAKAALGLADSDEAELARKIDGAIGQCVTWCNLVRAGTRAPTFGREAVRATWRALDREAAGCTRGRELALPWRVPISDLEVSENGVELEEGTDFDLDSATGIMTRIGANWSGREIVADWLSGWVLGGAEDPSADPVDQPPADLVQLVLDQVRFAWEQKDVDLTVRSQEFPGMESVTYNVAGGSAIGESGLLRPLQAALGPYRKIALG